MGEFGKEGNPPWPIPLKPLRPWPPYALAFDEEGAASPLGESSPPFPAFPPEYHAY